MASTSQVPSDQSPRLDAQRHTKYFLRCLKTYLPPPYTSNDSTRLSLAFFIVAALDLLDQLGSNTTPKERADYIDWVYSNQHPDGGFRGSPSSDLGSLRNQDNTDWDPAHVPATYFALSLLLLLDDDFSRFKRTECLKWLVQLQRDDGSFGETLVHGVIQGGRDSRYGYCAAGIRYMLLGSYPPPGQIDIKVDKLVECICMAESYDGGISDAPFHESHAGLTFCGLAALSNLGRLRSSSHSDKHAQRSSPSLVLGPRNPEATVRWLVSRQTATITDNDSFDTTIDSKITSESVPDAVIKADVLAPALEQASLETPQSSHHRPLWTGLNGRVNKIADTCYAFWVGGALKILDQPSLLHEPSLRKWLLERTAHPALGGFGKIAGDLPDVYHGYLGLAILSMTEVKEDGLLPLDATMCISQRAKGRLQPLWQRLTTSIR
ncbi:hypothetical protein ANO11243_005520 [Dothideomycetidae sp. 11243]|nr:hypothetical protein ANO11243_005520 [fungal sp. No.11243]